MATNFTHLNRVSNPTTQCYVDEVFFDSLLSMDGWDVL
jgi:hypothetical protein